MSKPTLDCPCRGEHLKSAFEYSKPPTGETKFDFGGVKYERGYDMCTLCKHWFSNNKMEMNSLYSGDYVDHTYGDQMLQTFERIISLPADQSAWALICSISRIWTFRSPVGSTIVVSSSTRDPSR